MNQISDLYVFNVTLSEEQEACFTMRRKVFVEAKSSFGIRDRS